MPGRSLVAADELTVASPGGRLKLEFQGAREGGWSYSLAADSRVIIQPSTLGLELGTNATALGPGWKLASSYLCSSNLVWKPVWGKRAVVPDRFNELTLNFKGPGTAPLRSLQVVARASDEGVAFRYVVPAAEGEGCLVTRELTRYEFAADYTAWFYNGENHNLGPERLSESGGTRLPVMTIKASTNLYLALHEADLVSGAPLVLRSEKGETAFSVASVPGRTGARLSFRVAGDFLRRIAGSAGGFAPAGIAFSGASCRAGLFVGETRPGGVGLADQRRENRRLHLRDGFCLLEAHGGFCGGPGDSATCNSMRTGMGRNSRKSRTPPRETKRRRCGS